MTPQEYPKMVPGPDGPTIVQSQQEEIGILLARIHAVTGEPAQITAAVTEPVEINVDAWTNARRAPQHDWIAALYRPYVPVV